MGDATLIKSKDRKNIARWLYGWYLCFKVGQDMQKGKLFTNHSLTSSQRTRMVMSNQILPPLFVLWLYFIVTGQCQDKMELQKAELEDFIQCDPCIS